MDNKAVHMQSNFLTAFPLYEIKRRKKGTSQKDNFNCPAVMKHYYEHMSGVDIMDRKKVTYQFDHRSWHKYYLGVVFDLIDIAVNNAYVVYNKVDESKTSTASVSSIIFRRRCPQFNC